MRRARVVIGVLLALAVATTATTPPAMAGKPTVKVQKSRFGKILVDGRGYTLYLFTRDPADKSRCYGECASAWPPLIVKGEPTAGDGARESLLGTTGRRGGARQATYRGHPLYYYVGDRRPGQIFCQNVVEFGGRWLIVGPDGRAVR